MSVVSGFSRTVASLLAESGFELTRVSGHFSGRPFERDSDELVVKARKR